MTNDKEKSMYRIVETVARCCATETCGGEASMTAGDLLGKGKGENVCMARTILVSQLLWAGYTVSTVAALLGRTPHAVRQMQRRHQDYAATSRAYRIALSEAVLLCRDIEPHGV